MNSVLISINYQTGISAKEILVYIGTVLIALGIVGARNNFDIYEGTKDLRALIFMLFGWPLRHHLNDMFRQNDFYKMINVMSRPIEFIENLCNIFYYNYVSHKFSFYNNRYCFYSVIFITNIC